LICGSLAADGFFRYRVKIRSDVTLSVRGERFLPVLGVVSGRCPGGSALACSLEDGVLDDDDPRRVRVKVEDLRAGTELSLVVAIESDVLQSLDPGPLDAELVVSSTPVWGAGERCGSICDAATSTCVEVMGASCAWPRVVDVSGDGEVVVDVPVGLGRAHPAECEGASALAPDGTRSVVLRLDLAPELAGASSTARLRLTATAPVRALDLRTPTCEATHRVACASDDAGGSLTIELDDLAARAARHERPALVVEVSPGPGENPLPAQFSLQYAVIDG
jgi:hypothetical protein